MSLRFKSYETLPALAVRGRELRTSLRYVTAGWMFGIIWMTIISGSRMNYFCRMLGFSDLHFGILTAMQFVASFGQVFATLLIERTGLRKVQFLYAGSIHRILWIPVALVPFLPGPATVKIAIMLSMLAVSWFMNAFSTPAWFNWMGDVIPRRVRGRYFAMRGIYSTALQIPAAIGLAWLIGSIYDNSKPMTPEAQPVLLYVLSGMFVLAGIVGTTDILLFRRIREVVRPVRDRPRKPAIEIDVPGPAADTFLSRTGYRLRFTGELFRQVLWIPMQDRAFRRYVTYGAVMMFAMTVSAAFCMRHMLETLQFGQLTTDSLFLVMGPLWGMAVSRPVGRLLDRWGRRPVLVLGTLGTVFSLWPYFLSSPHTPRPEGLIGAVNGLAGAVGGWFGQEGWQWIPGDANVGAYLIMIPMILCGAFGWRAVAMAQANVVLGFSDGHGRSKYVAASATWISLGGIAGGFAGGGVADAFSFLQDDPIRLGSFMWNNWHVTILLSDLARLTGLLLLINMPDPGSGKVSDLVRGFGQDLWNFAHTKLFFPVRVFGWGRRGSGEGRGDSVDQDADEDSND